MEYRVRYLTYSDAKLLMEESLRRVLNDQDSNITVDITGDKDIWSILIHGLKPSHGNSLCKLLGKSLLDTGIKEVYEGISDTLYSTDENLLMSLLYPEGGINHIFATENGFFAITGKDNKLSLALDSSANWISNTERLVSAMSMSIGNLTESILMPKVSSYSELVSAVANMAVGLQYIVKNYNISDDELAIEISNFS